jgi:arginine exporter protein ArgO
MVGMMRDHWWWPWWVSSLIDVALILLGVVVFVRSSRRVIRMVAAVFALGALVAAVMAPIVMTEKTDEMKSEMPMMP